MFPKNGNHGLVHCSLASHFIAGTFYLHLAAQTAAAGVLPALCLRVCPGQNPTEAPWHRNKALTLLLQHKGDNMWEPEIPGDPNKEQRCAAPVAPLG